MQARVRRELYLPRLAEQKVTDIASLEKLLSLTSFDRSRVKTAADQESAFAVPAPNEQSDATDSTSGEENASHDRVPRQQADRKGGKN